MGPLLLIKTNDKMTESTRYDKIDNKVYLTRAVPLLAWNIDK